MKTANDSSLRTVEKRQRRFFRKLPTIGVFEAMKVTLRTMLSKAATVQYPDERIELPERTRGVIALLPENCTVCMLCAKECPCWCIYIEGHKVTKPGKRKPLNELDRFAIDYGLCMYCGICVEVCPFDALHWSPFFEYTSYTYEGMVHEADVLEGWEDHVLPPPELVADADPKERELTHQAHEKRAEGVWGVIREQEKKDAYLAKQSAATVAYAPSPIQTAPVEAAAPAAAAVEAPAAPAPAPDAAPVAATPAAAAGAVETHAAADLGDVPRIDPNSLPDGIGPVERGRLKKLAELQHRGDPPTTDPVDLVAVLKPVLDQIRGSGGNASVLVRQIAFWILAGGSILSGLFVVTTRNVVHAALGLAAALLAAAGLFILFGAEFIGLAQILIYVGAVVILFLFGIMLTATLPGRPVVDNNQRWLALLVSAGVFVVLAIGILAAYGSKQLRLTVAFSTSALGGAVFTKWILPFEAVSVLLLAALVGAIVLARKD